jgi:predicted O-methyltransferase YrrM
LIGAQTAEAAQWWRGPIDLLYVDADHSMEGCVGDLRDWVPLVRAGGIVCGDDYENPGYPGVKEAWDQYEAETGQRWVREATTSLREGRFVWGIKQ